jgi:glutaredoxin 3
MYTIYGRPGCAPCKAAKDLLDNLGVEYTYVDVMALPKGELAAFLARGFKTVPQIFWEDTLIGGLDDLRRHIAK